MEKRDILGDFMDTYWNQKHIRKTSKVVTETILSRKDQNVITEAKKQSMIL